MPVSEPGGGVVALVGVTRDVTTTREAEEARRLIDQQLQETQKLESLGVLAGGIAHDFNNLLTGVLGNISLARLQLDNPDATSSHLDGIETSAMRAADLCQQMLAYAGKGRFHEQRLDLGALITDMLPLLKLSVAKGVSLRVDIGPGLPAMYGDPTQMRQVVLNLVTNASDAIAGTGTIEIRLFVVESDASMLGELVPPIEPGRRVGLPGPRDQRQRLRHDAGDAGPCVRALLHDQVHRPRPRPGGRPRDRARPSRRRARRERAAARVDVLGGAAGHHPARRPAQPAGAFDRRLAQHGRRPGRRRRGSGPRRRGARCCARSGSRWSPSRTAAKPSRPSPRTLRRFDLVLLDLTMPIMSGSEALQAIRQVRPDVPVLIMSGYNEQDTPAGGGGDQPAAFLHKPFSLLTLRDRLHEVLGSVSDRRRD